jgi:uncharacterized protein YegL
MQAVAVHLTGAGQRTDGRPSAEAIDSADNPEPRLACVLLLDTSDAMAGARLDHLNAALKTFRSLLAVDYLAVRRIELAVIAFGGGVRVVRELTTVEELDLPILHASGTPCLVGGLEKAVSLLETRRSVYKECGIPYHRPWIFTVTATPPDGDVERVTGLLRREEASKHLACFAVAVADLDLTQLGTMLAREPLQLEGLEFQKLFTWLSVSLRTAAYSEIFDAAVPLPTIDWQKKKG